MSAVPESADQRWVCPNCGRRYRLAAERPIPALCADCRRRQELGVDEVDPELSELPPQRERVRKSPGQRGALSSSAIMAVESRIGGYVGANPGMLRFFIAAAGVILVMLWFDTSSSFARLGAASLIAGAIWAAYLLIARWWPSERRLERIVAIVATPIAIYLYFMTAREIVESTDSNGHYSFWETRTWTGRPLWRRVAGKGSVSEGPLNAGGERHGEWKTWPRPPGRQEVWFWNGEEVTEKEWKHRKR